MQITILVDNTTNKRGLKAEHGLSFYIDDGQRKILFDTGSSSLFIENAREFGIDLLALDAIVLSHGHYDHSGGLIHLLDLYRRSKSVKKPVLYTHPATFSHRSKEGLNMGCGVSEEKLSTFITLNKTAKPVYLSDHFVFLGQISRSLPFEHTQPLGQVMIDGALHDDYMSDDSALVYTSDQGLVIITGCSHSGICNIVEQARNVCQTDRIAGIIGGFHLRKPPINQLDATIAYLRENHVKELYACHCTDLSSRIALSRWGNVHELSVGSVIDF